MSIKLMTAIFELDLQPGPKLLLLALGDNCDDHGYGFPSIATLARKASISPRTGIRYLHALEKRRLLHRTARRTTYGRQTSNAYQLNLEALYEKPPSDKLSASFVVTPQTALSRTFGGDTGGVQTIIQPPNEPPRGCTAAGASTANPSRSKSSDAILEGVGDAAKHASPLCVFPTQWRSDLTRAAERVLAVIAPSDAQMIVGELSARMSDGHVRHPLGYLRALVRSYHAGDFVPEHAHPRAAKRDESTSLHADLPDRAVIATNVLAAINQFKARRKFK